MAINWKIFTQRPYIKSLSLEEQVRLFNIANEKSIKLREQQFTDFANSNSTSQGAAGGEQKSSTSFTNTYSLDVDGNDDYVELGSLPNLQNATEYSISSWFKTPLNNFAQTIYSWSDGADGYLQLVLVDDGSFSVFNYRTSTAYGLSAAGLVSADTWYNATVIFDGGGATNADRLKLYINGSLVTLTYTGTIPTQTGTMLSKTMWLGASNSSNFWGFEGNIDEVSIFEIPISIGDVWDGSGQATDLNLLATPPINWYRFEEGSGTTATDSGSGGNDGTLENGATYEENVPV